MLFAFIAVAFYGCSVYGAMCPSHHRYVYYNGKFCCATNREKHYGPQGGRCDGSIISYGSLCCQNDNHYPCPGSNCQNYRAVDGRYGSWSAFSSCSATCGGGTQTRSRLCNSPKPSPGGRNCVGPSTGSQPCGSAPCPVDGKFGKWSSFGTCSASCGGGIQTRSRLCDSPARVGSGTDCVGSTTQSKACEVAACPVDGKFGEWTVYGTCSVSCGGGTQTRTRACDSPVPSAGGNECVGSTMESQTCGTTLCPVNNEVVGNGAMCPSHHRYAYYNGKFCCATNREKHYAGDGHRCDGSIIRYDSLCCQNDNHYPCPGSNCQNYKDQSKSPAESPMCKRSETYKKIGCFHTKIKGIEREDVSGMVMLISHRDKSSKYYKGHLIQWNDFGKSTRKLACDCAELARSKGLEYISIQYWGECFGGKDFEALKPSLSKKSKWRSPHCADSKFQLCDDAHVSSECVGRAKADYIYKVIY